MLSQGLWCRCQHKKITTYTGLITANLEWVDVIVTSVWYRQSVDGMNCSKKLPVLQHIFQCSKTQIDCLYIVQTALFLQHVPQFDALKSSHIFCPCVARSEADLSRCWQKLRFARRLFTPAIRCPPRLLIVFSSSSTMRNGLTVIDTESMELRCVWNRSPLVSVAHSSPFVVVLWYSTVPRPCFDCTHLVARWEREKVTVSANMHALGNQSRKWFNQDGCELRDQRPIGVAPYLVNNMYWDHYFSTLYIPSMSPTTPVHTQMT
uniref:CMP/dCMP-type deaminase domain-containing protein n=1 Tax=Steinernema glaseri TaxID=37863 RepID=A0A1I7ZBG7_9BILA